MTKEQEAIERCKSIVRVNKDFLKGNKQTINQEEIDCIETVLNMLKEKDKEIKTLKRDFKIVDQECSRLERKEAKQDKIIDLMAERIEWLCKSNGILLDEEHDENFTQEDIKQYFERKSKEC